MDRGSFFNDAATTEIYTLSLHDARPIWLLEEPGDFVFAVDSAATLADPDDATRVRYEDGTVAEMGKGITPDRKSTRLNSSHANISYAVFCLKKTTTHHPFHLHRALLHHV